MEKIRIKPIFGTHQIYQEIVNYPPQGVAYAGVKKGTKKGNYYQSKKIKERVGWLLQKLKIPRMIFVEPGNYDLIHTSRGIIPLNQKPWVIDVEHVHSFFGLNPDLIKNKFLKRFIERKLSSKYCKAVLCHCEATRQAFFRYLDCKNFRDKIKVLYPASHILPIKKTKHKKVRILAVLSLFHHKGGPQVLETFSRLEKKYKNIELWMKSDVPKNFKEKYNSENIKYFSYFGEILSREKLLKDIYSKCDIFLYPTLTDSFGYSLIDAMIARLPIITTNLFASPEIVEHEKTGFIVKILGYKLEESYVQSFSQSKMKGKTEKKFIEDCYNALVKLIENKSLRKGVGQKGFEMISKGRFSITVRNKKLEKIYREALNENSSDK